MESNLPFLRAEELPSPGNQSKLTGIVCFALIFLFVGLCGIMHGSPKDTPASLNIELFDCETYPKFCQAPFNCQNFTMNWSTDIVAKDGHANPSAFCYKPWVLYYDYLAACVSDSDPEHLTRAGHICYNETDAGTLTGFGKHTQEFDASFCFIVGHCTNHAVTTATTIAEAEKMCDERFGHTAWADATGQELDAEGAAHPEELADPKNGFGGIHNPNTWLKQGCAMGNYHCDVIYCQVGYCFKQYWIEKYGHLAP